MHLVYFDESGNTGNNLNDDEQPVFVLGALVVSEHAWQEVERRLEEELAARFPQLHKSGEEIHSADLRGARKHFKNVPVEERVALISAWLKVAAKHGLSFAYRSIDKKKYQKWVQDTFGHGVMINPHVAAFPLLAMVVNGHLSKRNARGIFISDDNKEVVRDLEKSIKGLRLTAGPLKLSQIVEKGFFIYSAKSRILQLCDLCVLQARKKEEQLLSKSPFKPIDEEGVRLIAPLHFRGEERFTDVIEWLKKEREASGGK